MTFDPSFLSNFMLILTAWGGAFLAALWLSLIIWTYRDIRGRARDPLGRILAVLVVAVLFLPGIVIYLILRPLRTLEDEYQHTLEEEALLQSIEDVPICPGCGRHTKDDWKICPNCHTRLKKACHQCGKLMDLPWNLCPFCSTPTPGQRRENLTLDDALEPLAGLTMDEMEDSDLFEELDELGIKSSLDFNDGNLDFNENFLSGDE
jgi:RNA polymerase subunit RPABC4/transcription elongation factor Spt4